MASSENEQTYKTHEEILKDLENISPLALPDYLNTCEYYDQTRAIDILEKANAEFKNNGGIASELFRAAWHSVVNSVGLCLLRKFDNNLYRKVVKSKSTDFAKYAQLAFTFEYPETYHAWDTPDGSYVVDSMKQDSLRRGMSQLDMDHYEGGKDYRDKQSTGDFLARNSQDGQTVYGLDGKPLNIHDDNRSQRAEADHVVPLQTIHNQSKYFIQRYVDLDKTDEKGRTVLQQIVNDDKNFQVLPGDKNASKGGALTNIQFIEQVEKIEKASNLYKQMETASPEEKQNLQAEINKLNLSKTKRDAARQIANEENLSPEEKEKLKKYKLTEEEKKKLRENQNKAEKHLRKEFIKQGGETVLIEQIGKIIEIMIGPVGFELRDSIKNGIQHGFEDCNTFVAFSRRIWRALKYTIQQLGNVLVGLVKDMAKMLSTFFLAACKALQSFFGKFFDLALSGISVIIDAIQILMGKGSMMEKGDAILKLIVGFSTGILGQFVIDTLLESLGLPDPFSDIAAAVISAVISTLVMGLFDRLDVFGLKEEMRRQRIEEIFRLRRKKLEEDISFFQAATSAKILEQKKKMESFENDLVSAFSSGNYERIDHSLDNILDFFDMETPYSSFDSFLEWLKQKEPVVIE